MSLETLPPEQAARLRLLHAQGDHESLKTYIAALRAQQWPLRAIGEPLGLSRSTIHYFERNAKGPKDTSSIPLPERAFEVAGAKTVRWRTHLPPEQRDRLADLAKKARRVRAQTPANSELRIAADTLDTLIEVYLHRMVPVTEIADAMGVTHRAVTARIERRNETD
jgi:hypothetical protein